jgi:hypothetical protein
MIGAYIYGGITSFCGKVDTMFRSKLAPEADDEAKDRDSRNVGGKDNVPMEQLPLMADDV